MIVMVKENASRLYTGRRREVFIEALGRWHKVIGHKREHVVIEITDQRFEVKYGFLKEIINDDRHLHEVCTYCGAAQKSGLDTCRSCGRSREAGYLARLRSPLYGEPITPQSPEEVLKGSMQRTFGI